MFKSAIKYLLLAATLMLAPSVASAAASYPFIKPSIAAVEALRAACGTTVAGVWIPNVGHYAWNGSSTATPSDQIIQCTGVATGRMIIDPGPLALASITAMQNLPGVTTYQKVFVSAIQGGDFVYEACGGAFQPNCTANDITTFSSTNASYVWLRQPSINGVYSGPFVTPQMAGAYGDGAHDDGAALNAALAYEGSLPHGGAVFCPAGQYNTSVSISVPSLVAFYGPNIPGPSSPTTALTSGSCVIAPTTDVNGLSMTRLASGNNSGIAAHDIEVVYPSASGFTLSDGVYMNNQVGDRIDRIFVFRAPRDGFHLDGTTNSYHNYFSDDYSNNAARYSYYNDGQWTRCINCVADGGTYGFYNDTGGLEVHIERSHFEGPSNTGIYSGATYDALWIENNYINDPANVGMINGINVSANNAAFINNNQVDKPNDAIGSSGLSVGNGSTSLTSIVTANNVTGFQTGLSSGSYNIITNNVISSSGGNTGNDIYISGTQVILSGNNTIATVAGGNSLNCNGTGHLEGMNSFDASTVISCSAVFGTTASAFKEAPLTFASLPVCNAAAKGYIYYVSDGTATGWNAAVAGSGTGIVAQCNGTSWVAE